MVQKKPEVLVVEDTEENIDILIEILSDNYNVSVAIDGMTALESVKDINPDLILLDVMMPGLSGYEVCEKLKEDPVTQHIPVIFLTALSRDVDESKGLGLGAVDYITKPFNPALLKSRVKNHLELKQYQNVLEDMVSQKTYALILMQEATIQSMAILAEYRDPDTGGHIQRTKSYVKLMAEYLHNNEIPNYQVSKEDIQVMAQMAPLHDIGKVGVPDNILLKPGKLTEEEFEIMKMHSCYGGDAIARVQSLLTDASFLDIAHDIARHHHERWDGTGYPDKLREHDIPLSARIMALADVYDALSTKRPYKDAMPHEEVMGIIMKSEGTHLDPVLGKIFNEQNEKFLDIRLRYQ